MLAGAAVVSATAAIAAEWHGQERRHRSFYLLKPLTSLLILALAATVPAHTPPEYRMWVMAALLFCTAGDICLMFKGDGWFLGGLSSFLLGHALFIVAFVQGLPRFELPWWSAFWGLAVLPFAVLLIRRAGTLRIPVAVYMLVIAGMALTAAARFNVLGDNASLLALIGASVFMVSDASLGVRQFIGPYRYAQPLILSTYWLAIGLIACSV